MPFEKQRNHRSSFDLIGFLKCFLVGTVCFYLGISVGSTMLISCDCDDPDSANLRATLANEISTKSMQELVDKHKEKEKEWTVQLDDLKAKIIEHKTKLVDQQDEIKKLTAKEPYHQNLFRKKHVGNFVSGMTFVDRDEFAQSFDTGVPVDPSGWANDQVFIMYSDKTAMPSEDAKPKRYESGWEGLSVEDATKNCRNLNIVLSAPGRGQQCVALMGQYESYHVQKFMRMVKTERRTDRKIDMSVPLRSTNRQMTVRGEKSVSIPDKKETEAFWKILPKYMNALDGVLNELRPIAKAVASQNPHETIIIMVCNYGHSEMLLNFVCNAHSKGKETEEALKSVLIFPTDLETHKLAQGLGLSSFYSETVFGHVPEQAAKEYGDEQYSQIMLAKVYCVHLISQLGYDLIFQDVDIVWYKNPIPFFYTQGPDENNFDIHEWDMIFQDDGARTLFFAPYSANTGFYFVRNNKGTKHFFNQLLLSGDSIFEAGSHQNVLISLLAEHASLYNLRIKTWNRMAEEFPGGYSFHMRKDFMKQLIHTKNSTDSRGLIEPLGDKADGIDPYLFHMSWTLNKDNKVKFFQQFGEWYLEDQCNAGNGNAAIANPTISNCCAVKPLISCHFKDKPSIIPCPDAPSIDRNEPSFW